MPEGKRGKRCPEAWTDRAFWSNDPNITTCKEIWGTSATAEGSEGRQGSWGNEAQGSSIGEGRADSEILQELESYRDPSKVRKSSESWDRSAVGPTFLRPTSAHSSRLRSTVVSPRILLTSGRSGSGTCSSTSSHSVCESPGMARPRCCAPRRAPLDLWVHRSERWVTGILLVSRPGPGTPTHASPASGSHRPRPQPGTPTGLTQNLIPFCRPSTRLKLLGPKPLVSGALFCSTADRLSEATVSGRGPGNQEALAPPLPRGRHPGNGASYPSPAPRGPRPRPFQGGAG